MRVYTPPGNTTYVSLWNDHYMLTREVTTSRTARWDLAQFEFVLQLMQATLDAVGEAPGV